MNPEANSFSEFLRRVLDTMGTPEQVPVDRPDVELVSWTADEFIPLQETFREHHKTMTADLDSPRLYCDCEHCSNVREVFTAIQILNTITVMEAADSVLKNIVNRGGSRMTMNRSRFPRQATPVENCAACGRVH